MKRISIIASGTRGDVQPAIALAKALNREGHQVSVLAGANFREWIEAHGVTAIPSGVNIQEMMHSEGGKDWVERGHNPLVQKRLMQNLLDKYGWQMVMDAWNACQGADAIVSSFTSDTYTTAIAEKLGVPQVSMPLQPALIATRDGWAVPSAPAPNRRSLVNLWFSKLFIEPFPWQLYGSLAERLRKELGLPPQSASENKAARHRLLTLQAFSPLVVPPPTDWPDNVHTTGYWFLDEEAQWQPPSDLLSFLESGEPPVYVGFGSMTGRKAEKTTQLVLDSLAKSQRRAIVASGWEGLRGGGLPETVFQVDAVPHSWLFPRMAALVHHGGAGTTAAGLRAGIPSLVVPHFADQPFWGQRIHALDVGPEPIPRQRLTAEKLAEGIVTAATDPHMRERAAALGEKVRAEDGLGQAMKLFASLKGAGREQLPG